MWPGDLGTSPTHALNGSVLLRSSLVTFTLFATYKTGIKIWTHAAKGDLKYFLPVKRFSHAHQTSSSHEMKREIVLSFNNCFPKWLKTYEGAFIYWL